MDRDGRQAKKKKTNKMRSYNGRMLSFPPFCRRTEGFRPENTGREIDLIGPLMRKTERMVLKNLGVSAFARRGVPDVCSSHVGKKKEYQDMETAAALWNSQMMSSFLRGFSVIVVLKYYVCVYG